jgi:signal transduction histidine kinase/FixJ family two-component response regulator
MDGTRPTDELEQRLRQQALLAEIGRRALSDANLDTLLTEAARLCALGLEVRFCKILEYLPSENRFLVRAGVGWHPGVVGRATIGADLESPAGYALHTGKPVIANRLAEESRFRTPQLLAEHGVERAVNVILDDDGKPFGALEADSEAPGAFSEHDADFLQGVANLLGVALGRRRVEDELRRLNEELEQRVAAEIAERQQAEDALRQAQKMEAVGKLTGGIAHDFNNLLTLITGSLELIGNEVAGKQRLARMVATAQRGASRGAQLTAQLLAFARRQALRPETRPINELIAEFDVLAGPILGDAIAKEFWLDPTAGACHVDPAQFGSALLNLAVNARDAMPNGGTFSVRTGNLDLDERAASRHADARPCAYVFVEVADTGTGMLPEVLDRATEPFFTTKETGHGTGLGLSQVHGFVSQSHGFLIIDSSPGEGTRVRIHLPREHAVDGSNRERGATARKEITGAMILVVEDDVDVRSLVIEQLEDLGYRTMAAATGKEALELVAAKSEEIELVFTDVVMSGGMSGVDLVHALHVHRPSLPVVLTSGFMASNVSNTGNPADMPETNDLDLPVLAKPYRHIDLARVIEQALGRRRNGRREERRGFNVNVAPDQNA